MPEKPVEQQQPDVLAMILAEAVLSDVASEKLEIRGVFSVLPAAEFPWTHSVMVVYTAITGGHGKTPLRLRIIDVDEVREAIVDTEMVVDFPDPITVLEPILVVKDIVFPEPGEYRVQLYGAGQFLRERRLQVGQSESRD
jgi:hypothetical protein